MAAWLRRGRSLAYFFLIPGISAVAPLLALPAITASFGVEGWASVAIGLSFGMAGATIVELGWSVTGPQAIARGNEEDRRDIFFTALSTKLIASLLIVPLVAVLSFWVAPSFKSEAAALAAASTLASLGTSWYFVGLARPLVILFTDTIPRVVLLVAAAALIAAGGSLFAYPISIGLAAIFCLLVGSWIAKFRPWPPLTYFKDVPVAIRGQFVIIIGRVIGTGYTSLTVALVGITSPSSVAVFAAVERIMRMGLAVLAGFPNRLQSWLGSARGSSELSARVRLTIISNGALGVFAGVVFAILAPPVITILFLGEIEVEPSVVIGGGVVVALICASRGLGLALIAARSPGSVTVAIVLASAVGVPLLFALPPLLGPFGAILAEISAEFVGVLTQAVLLFIVRRRHRH